MQRNKPAFIAISSYFLILPAWRSQPTGRSPKVLGLDYSGDTFVLCSPLISGPLGSEGVRLMNPAAAAGWAEAAAPGGSSPGTSGAAGAGAPPWPQRHGGSQSPVTAVCPQTSEGHVGRLGCQLMGDAWTAENGALRYVNNKVRAAASRSGHERVPRPAEHPWRGGRQDSRELLRGLGGFVVLI